LVREARRLKVDVSRLLIECSGAGRKALETLTGAALGHEVIAAQDFSCLLDLTEVTHGSKALGALVDEKACAHLQAWIEDAGIASLDEDAIKVVLDFKRHFPIPSHHLLPNVHTTHTEEEIRFAQRAQPSLRICTVKLTGKTAAGKVIALPDATQRQLASAAFDGAPTSKMKDAFEMLAQEVEWPDVGTHRVTRKLLDNWLFQLVVRPRSPRASAVQSVYIGGFPAHREPEDPCSWLVDLKAATSSCRHRVFTGKASVIFGSGVKIILE
jgi:hypothetical protein